MRIIYKNIIEILLIK
ncbi:hypothetical protein CAEBREN_04538 [Caenorhabditis brenneri]|uniref:Uncharacterized protein n=1 Tax=Caenorhabditis brenneri TaxID=135651 RepID=G0NST4_CAEBE|nr:hypothetical protein CAEBREN_04538 [Caenorhabditis brenneri]